MSVDLNGNYADMNTVFARPGHSKQNSVSSFAVSLPCDNSVFR